jgi:hypothetical protein
MIENEYLKINIHRETQTQTMFLIRKLMSPVDRPELSFSNDEITVVTGDASPSHNSKYELDPSPIRSISNISQESMAMYLYELDLRSVETAKYVAYRDLVRKLRRVYNMLLTNDGVKNNVVKIYGYRVNVINNERLNAYSFEYPDRLSYAIENVTGLIAQLESIC